MKIVFAVIVLVVAVVVVVVVVVVDSMVPGNICLDEDVLKTSFVFVFITSSS